MQIEFDLEDGCQGDKQSLAEAIVMLNLKEFKILTHHVITTDRLSEENRGLSSEEQSRIQDQKTSDA